MRRLLDLLAADRQDVLAIYSYAALAGVLGLAVPLGVQAIIGLVSGGLLLQPVVILIVLVVLAASGVGVVQVLQLGVVERIQQRIFARIALLAAHRLSRVDPERIGATDLPELTNRFFEVITLQKSLAKLLADGVTALLAIAAGLALLTFYHPYLSLCGTLLLGALAALLALTGRRGLDTSLAESAAKYRVAHWLQELARSATEMGLAPDSSLPLARMDRELDEYLAQRQAHFRIVARQAVSIVAAKSVITGALLVIGTLLVVNRQITLGQFVASELVIVILLGGVEKLVLSLGTVYDALTAAEKVSVLDALPVRPGMPVRREDDMDTVSAAHATPGAAAIPDGVTVTARDLTYRYAGASADTLRALSLDLDAGARVAIVGNEGAGSTTLLHVLAGLLPSYGGALSIGDQSMREFNGAGTDARIALVMPQVRLLDASLAHNVSLGRPGVTTHSVLWALDVVGLKDFVLRLRDGVETRVDPALRLPTQVARKLSIARAIATRPQLLLLDDCFHGLDREDKEFVIQGLLAPEHGWTVVVASHDPIALRACDRVLTLEDGSLRLLATTWHARGPVTQFAGAGT